MRLRRITLRGVTRFTAAEPITLDLKEPGAGLVALVGTNGAGKTTFLEATVAALYRSFPTRPGWYEQFFGRDAFLEVDFVDGTDDIRVRTQVDAERRTTEQYIFVDGVSVTTGRAKEAEAYIEHRFGSLELLLASVFAAQGKQGNFLLATKGQRKELFAELLGLSRLQNLHEAARERQLLADNELAGARIVARNVEVELEALPGLEEELAGARARVEEVVRALEAERCAETSAAEALEAMRRAWDRAEDLRRAVEAAERELEAATGAVSEAEESLRRVETHARERQRLLEAQDPDAAERRARDRHETAGRSLAERRAQLELVVAGEPQVLAAAAQVAELEAELAELEHAEGLLLQLQAEEKVAAGAAIAADRRWKDAMESRAVERKRLVRQGTLLDSVPCTDRETWQKHTPDGRSLDVALSAECPLLQDARTARQALDELIASPEPDTAEVERARAVLEGIRSRLSEASVACDPIRVQDIRRELPKLRRTAADIDVLERAKTELAGMEAQRSRIDEMLALEIEAAELERQRIAVERSSVEEARAREGMDALGRLGDAQRRVAEATARREEASKEFHEATEATAGRYGVEKRHGEAVERRKAAEGLLRTADQVAAGVAAQVEQLARKREDLTRLQTDVELAEVEVGDWSLLARALGKDGIQALEIDAAGPEVARVTNELLEACYGSRFSISFETLREKKSARGEYSEAFDVKVYDQGHERTVEALSGGERVVVGEAVGLAIAIFNSRKSGIRWETLFRDETAGALDAVNAAAYVDMLRRALELGGFHQVLFVSHSPEVWERADVRLLVEGGTVSVMGGGWRNATSSEVEKIQASV